MAGDILIDAAAAPAGGPPELRLSFVTPERLRLADFCSGAPDGHWVNVSVNGDGAFSASGCDDDRFDPGAGGSPQSADQLGINPGEQVEVRIWVSSRPGGSVADVAGVELALGAYEVPEPAATVAGWDAPEEYEYEGHTWKFVDFTVGAPGQGSFAPRGRIAGQILALVSYDVGPSARVRLRAGDQFVTSDSSGRAPFLLGEDDRVVVRVVPGLTPDTRLGAAYYRRVD